MRLLIDTHAFLWWVEGSPVLPARARAAIADPDNECMLSLVSAWEMAIKSGLGKLKLSLSIERYLVENVAANGFRTLEMSLAHIGRVKSLPWYHRDPFDRLLIAQALEEELTVVTGDAAFRKYGLKRIW
jgi:PIN domain nuclease of toxin-antitoxin system